MNDLIWNYISRHYDEYGIIPSWEKITEDLDESLAEQDFDELHHTVTSFVNMHDMTGVSVEYKGEPRNQYKTIRKGKIA